MLVVRLQVHKQAPRVSSFAASLLIHGLIISGLALVSRVAPAPHETRASLEKKFTIVWYPKPKLPDVSPKQKSAAKKSIPRPLPTAAQTVLSTSKDAMVLKQIILQPPDVRLKQEVPAPNIVQFALPPPPKAAPKQFVPLTPEPRDSPPVAEVTMLAAPQVADPKLAVPIGSAAAMPKLPKPPARNFAPVAEARSQEPTAATPLPDAPPPVLPGQDARFLSTLVVSRDPIDHLKAPLPPGSLPGQVSASADEEIRRRAGGNAKAGVTVANVIVREGRPEPAPSPYPAMPRASAQERARAAARASVSAPLRTLPQLLPVQTTFRDRTVFTCLLEMPKAVPGYETLVVWFAESEGKASPLLMRAPVLVRAEIPQLPAKSAVKDKLYVKLHINGEGLVRSAILSDATDEALMAAIQKSVGQWEFVPATKNGQPVEIDAVLEIPLALKSQLSGN